MNIKNREITDHFLLGINYWPSSSALNMWTEWNPKELADDADRIKQLGMNCCRFFLYMPAFMDMEDRVNPIMLERLKYFMSLYEEREIFTLPTFIVGHMSGEDWDVPWRKGADFISDSRIIKATELYITTIVKEIKNFSGIFGWLLSNELPNYIGNQPPEAVSRWVERIISVIKKIDPDRPVSIGDGAWCPEIIGQQTGFHLRKLNRFQDFVGLHYYPREMSAWRHSFTTAFRLRLAEEWGKPVIVEEFGTSTTLCSEENQAKYYRSVFRSALINGAQGVLSWCLNDFDFTEKRPYSHHAYEERFGIVRMDQTNKPAAQEFEKFQEILNEIIPNGFDKIERNVGLLIPSNYYYEYPYQYKPQFLQWYDLYLETFSLLKRANLGVRMVIEPVQEVEKDGAYSHELELNPDEIPVLFAPRLKVMTKKMCVQIEEYVRKGGTFYFSFANDSWVLDWHLLAGIEMDCKFGVPDFPEVVQLTVGVKKNWGEFVEGEKFQIPLNNASPEYSYCPILKVGGKVICEDMSGAPFLIENRIGKGKVFFTPYPIEMLSVASTNDGWKSIFRRIYRSIAMDRMPGLEIQIEGDGLESGIWKKKEEYKVVIQNHAWTERIGILKVPDTSYVIQSSNMVYKKISDCKTELN
ncbi:MAG: cellulase family glycosylhydrolase, partial [Candidatus Neomarinimicrobiota bacterium]